MSAPQKTVLVVDDSSLMRRLISEIVEADAELRVVDVAESGRVALQKVRQHRPDCVLLDIEMPELSGLDTLRRLALRSSAKVVILSHLGHDGSRVRAEALRLGAADVIDKPGGSVTRDLRTTRGRAIRQTLRRVLGLAALPAPDERLPDEGASTTVSVLAVDVQRFTALFEHVEAPALMAALNGHFALVDRAVAKHGGIVDTRLGALTLAVFGAPRRSDDHASRAVAAAGELLAAMAAARAAGAQEPDIEAILAIVTGPVLAGALGPPEARRYRVAGPPLALAARMVQAGEGYGAAFILCGHTRAAIASGVDTRRLDVVQTGRQSDPIVLYEVMAKRADADPLALEAYARGMDHYELGRFAKAGDAFEEALRRSPSDRASARLLARCRALLAAPAALRHGGWPLDGVGD